MEMIVNFSPQPVVFFRLGFSHKFLVFIIFVFLVFYLSLFCNNWYQSVGLIWLMATMRYHILFLDCSTRFSLWQVKMVANVVRVSLHVLWNIGGFLTTVASIGKMVWLLSIYTPFWRAKEVVSIDGFGLVPGRFH